MTFDVIGDVLVAIQYDWMTIHEVVGKCRHCHQTSIFKCSLAKANFKNDFRQDGALKSYKGTINDAVTVNGPITIREVLATPITDHLPDPLPNVFAEGTSSVAAGCYNAAGAMFRLCLDLATKQFLPDETAADTVQPSRNQREKLAFRLNWLFDQGKIPQDLKELATCVRENGNDGAHDGTLTEEDARDLEDFTVAFLERVYTEPGRIRAAQQRRDLRRRKPTP